MQLPVGLHQTGHCIVKINSIVAAPSALRDDWQHIYGTRCSDPPKNTIIFISRQKKEREMRQDFIFRMCEHCSQTIAG